MFRSKLKTIGLIGLLSTLMLDAIAQNSALSGTTTKRKGQHWLGAHAGTTTSLGLSYRFQPGRLGLQLTALPLYNSKQFIYSGGATLLFALRETERTRFVSFVSSSASNLIRTKGVWHSGLGLGFETQFGSDFFASLLLGYGARNLGDYERMNIAPSIGFGLYYRLL